MEKNSCRALVDKCKLMPDQCCQPCKDVLDLSPRYLANHRELWYGVCHRLHFPDLMNQDSEQAATPKRRQVATARYEATPSKGKMLYMFKDASPKRESAKKTKMNALQAISNLQDRDVDRAIASRYVAAADDRTDNKENKKISWCSLPNGGQSKAAVNKRKKLAGQVFNGMAKQIGGSNANDFREEAIDTSLKQAPFLMCGDCSPSKSSSEQAAPTSAAHGSADKATTDDHYEELDVQDSSDEATTGNSPSRVSYKKMRGRKQRLTKRQERLKSEIGTSLIADLQKMEKNEERRPILACHTEYTKDELERVSDSCMSSTSLCYFSH